MMLRVSKKWRWLIGLFAVPAIAAGLYALVGFYLLPYVIQTQVWPRLSEKMGGHFHAEQSEFNPFKLSLAMRGFSLKGPEHVDLVDIGQLHVDVDALASIKAKALVADVKITQPSINIAFDREGKPNFGFLLSTEEKPKDETPTSIFPFLLTQFTLEKGRLAFEDQSRGSGYKTVWEPLDFSLANFGTASDSDARYTLNAHEEGKELVSTDGDMHFENSAIAGELQLQDIKLPPLAAWLASSQGIVVREGLLSLKLQYRYGKETDFEIPALEATISNLSLTQDGKPLLDVGSIATHEFSYQLKSNQLQLKNLSLDKIKLQGAASGDIEKVNANGLSFDLKANQLKLASLDVNQIGLKSPNPVDVALINGQNLSLDLNANQLKLDAINVDKVGIKAPNPADIASIKAQGLGFDIKANQVKLDSVNIDKIGLKAPNTADVASIKTQGLSFDLTAHQLKLASINVDKIGLKAPNQADVASVNAQGLSFDINANQLKLDSIGAAKIGVLNPVPVDVGSINLLGLGFDLKSMGLHLNSAAVEKVDLKTTTPFKDDNGKPRLTGLGSLKLDDIGVNLTDKSLHLAKVTTKNTTVAAWLEKDGSLGFPGMPPAHSTMPPAPTPAALPTPAFKLPPEKAWQYAVDVIELNDNDIALRDFAATPPVAMRLSPLNLLVKNFSSETGKPFWLGMNTGLTMNGRIALEGKFTQSPLSAVLKVYVDDLSLPGFQTYIDNSVGFRLVKGKLNLNADIDFEAKEQQKMRFVGDLAVADLATDDKREGKDFINCKYLRLNSIVFENTPQRVSVKEVLAKEPYVRAILSPDKKFNIAENLSPPGKSKSTTPVKQDAPPPPQAIKPVVVDPIPANKLAKVGKKSSKTVKAENSKVAEMPSKEPSVQTVKAKPEDAATAIVIGVVRIQKATSDFTDMTIQPNNFSLNIHDLTGDIRSLSSRQESKSDVMLDGKLNEGSPVKIYGKINLFSVKLFTDIVLKVDDVNLTTLSPYSGKFAGYRIEKGKLSMDLHYKLANGQLTAENKFILDRLTLGERVESADATSLPVSLAISLLKDANGRIDLNLPVSGDLSNPQIDIWGLLGNAVSTLLTKLVSAPFNLMGSLVSGSSTEDLGTVKFSPGNIELSAQEKGKLDDVAKALQERPALNLEIKGTAQKELDRPILAEQSLSRQLQNTRLFELGRTKRKESETPEVSLSEQDYARLLTNLFRSKFPTSPEVQDLKSDEALTGEPLENAKRKLLAEWVVSEADLRSLAQSRGKSIRNYLVQGLSLPGQRIYLLDVKLLGQDEKEIKAILSLNGS